MGSKSINIFWVIFWGLAAAGWAVLSFQWLRKEVEAIQPTASEKAGWMRGLLLRRVVMFILFGLMLFLALRTEPLAVIGMVIAVTLVIWAQVIAYHKRQNSHAVQKEK